MSIPASVLDATNKSIQDKLDEHDRVWNAAIEAAAKIVDDCNREGPYQAIAAPSRIRELKK